MFLENINTPDDIKKLSIPQLNLLCQEIRKRIIEVVSSTGGHLASSLGAVELIVSLHYCLDLPKDKIIFDVGHQAYAHKLLTGRNKDFSTLRQYRGISGFPSKEESIYDSFTTGHSSVAVSLALGLVCAQELLKEESSFKVVAVIGDGSLSGGLCFEGLNNAGYLRKDLLVILNTNELSITSNVGALSTYINKIISLPIYNRFRQSLEQFIKSRIPKGTRILKLVDKFGEALKGLFIPGIFFEELGFRYFGPIDGHNLEILIPTLKNILSLPGPRILHVITKKGKGFPPAEAEPVRFHSAVPFEIETGKSKLEKKFPTYTEVFSEKLIQLAKINPKIVAITAAMPEGTGLDKFRDEFPERFFDVGIAEEHAVCFASGLAKAGLKPVVAIYSTFLQRAYDQIIEEISLQELAVILAIDRAGIVGEDGPTHQGVFDIIYLRSLPNLVLMAPKDGRELEMMLEFAVNLNKPAAIRYPKSEIPSTDNFRIYSDIEIGRPEILEEGEDFIIFALGSMVLPSLEAVNLLKKEGFFGTLVNMRFVKPIDKRYLEDLVKNKRFIFTVEEGILEGGFGSAIQELISKPVIRLGIPSEFVTHGKRKILLENYGLNPEGIYKRISLCLR
ncbi:MAG: 1-deoxy-D-xylulose-5-phosphate synthase [Candidatus Omnitrophica bacterium]|nr:1-deoxy-D-xylulose-5-phosphate synthase [Candidatus Omnitrophota bacterium]MCM8799861.1 1-deoxy-D-xylulose-5-phosphate synthase [Candidatus Omnitrophota bacterium]